MHDEVSTVARIGITLLLIACAVIASLSIMFIASTFSDDFYEQTIQTVSNNDASLDDIVGVNLPIAGIVSIVDASKYRSYDEIVYKVYARPYDNGVGGDFALKQSIKRDDLLNDYSNKVGILTDYTAVTANGKDTLTLVVEIGGYC